MTRPLVTDERPPDRAAPPAAHGARQRHRRLRRKPGGRRPRAGVILLFLLPALVLFTLLVLIPILIGGYASFFRWNGHGGLPSGSAYVGLDNFVRALSHDVFRGNLRNAAILIILSVVIQLPLAMGLALLLNQRLPGRALFRVLFFAPYVLAEVVTAILFKAIFSPSHGLANHVVGLLDTLIPFVTIDPSGWGYLGSQSAVLYLVFFVITWKYFGFHMILYLAGRQNIPKEVTEAAVTDGATAWQVFRHVTLPLLGPTVRITIFLSVIGTIQLFDMVWGLTRGGPVNASETMAVYLYRHGFERFEVGYASAVSVIMFLISLIFALGYQRFVMRRDLEGAATVMGGTR